MPQETPSTSPWVLPPDTARRYDTVDLSYAERRALDQKHFAACKAAATERITKEIAAKRAEFAAVDAEKMAATHAAKSPLHRRSLADVQRRLAEIPGMVIPEKAAPLEQGRRRF